MGVSPLVRDGSWVRQAFLVKKEELEDATTNAAIREFSTVQMKFTDTTPGGNVCINPAPQFSRFCDLRQGHSGKMNMRRGEGGASMTSRGMGLYYSEAIDDQKQVINMRFGVPSFNTLTTFFTGFYNSGASTLARTGRAPGMLYTIGKVVGSVVPLFIPPLLGLMIIGKIGRFILDKPASKFYNLKPTMPTYWAAVQTIVNHICVNAGIVPRVGGGDGEKFNDGYQFGPDAAKKMHELLPDIFNAGGSVDVFALANRGQRIARKEALWWQQNFGDTNFTLASMASRIKSGYDNKFAEGKRRGFEEYLNQWKATGTAAVKPDGTAGTETKDKSAEGTVGWFEFLQAELDDGAAFASFRVNATGTVSESFSNTVGESELKSKFDGMSSASRSTRFSFAEGNLMDAGSLVGGALSAVGDFTKGVVDGVGLSGLAALGGSAFVDIPQHWQSSTAQLPRSTYTINLVSPYNNPISRLTNIYIPMAMLLAGTLPLSAGKQSYTSPFILELYDKGRCTTRLGMIDSLSISRGEGNTGWHKDGHFLGVTIQFSVVDLSSVVHMPLIEGFTFKTAAAGGEAGTAIGGFLGALGMNPVTAAAGAAAGGVVGAGAGAVVDVAKSAVQSFNDLFDDETVFTDYMATLSSVGLADLIYPSRRFKRNATLLATKWDTFLSPAHFMSYMGDIPPARLASIFYKGTVK